VRRRSVTISSRAAFSERSVGACVQVSSSQDARVASAVAHRRATAGAWEASCAVHGEDGAWAPASRCASDGPRARCGWLRAANACAESLRACATM